MADPINAQNGPYTVSVKAGEEYYWCACGRSRQQPFCDGSHKGTGIKPMRFIAEEDEELSLCGCKQTQTPPFCDNTHDFLD